jgi:hypothetical protein
MADFCLGPDAIIGITREVYLMDRMQEGRHSGPCSSEGRSGAWGRRVAATHRLRREPAVCSRRQLVAPDNVMFRVFVQAAFSSPRNSSSVPGRVQ